MLNRYLPSFRARRTVATAVLAAFMCAGCGLLFLLFAGGREADLAHARVTDAWNRVVPLIREGPLPPVLYRGEVEAIQVLDARGRVAASTPGLIGKPPIATFRAADRNVRTTRVLCPRGSAGCVTVTSYKVYQPQGVWLLYVAVPEVPWYGTTTDLLLVIGISVVVTTMMTAWSFRNLTKAMAPVNAIRAELGEITLTALDRRVPVPANYQEIRLLAETVNDTLDRLESASTRLRRFTADASHELRTPITAMRAQLEEALLYPHDTDWPRMTHAVLAGVDLLQVTAADLLTLTHLDARPLLRHDLTDLGRLAAAELRRRPRQHKIVEDLAEGVHVECDRLRITRLLCNLLDNAERHAASRITVSVRAEGTSVIMEVADDGAGIPAEHREMVFDRFTRVDTARDRGAGGTGLGLAIAREIAEAHEGALTIEDSERGACFVLRLPAYDTCRSVRPG
ncbi:HAMP domain-containing sensor histidine kinase [Streptosporangium sp. NPDC002524]|uniref:sensor histidine kinase n=1 Tax=Streptosporangium sp. NPDC002524 TaxID=3154537 RepID=UPI00332DEFED